MPMRKGLFAIALHDEALFHTFMSHYVASFELRFGRGDPAESLQHRTDAIRIVNERLRDRTQALADGTIAAVANIAIYEVSPCFYSRILIFTKRLAVNEWMQGKHAGSFKGVTRDGPDARRNSKRGIRSSCSSFNCMVLPHF